MRPRSCCIEVMSLAMDSASRTCCAFCSSGSKLRVCSNVSTRSRPLFSAFYSVSGRFLCENLWLRLPWVSIRLCLRCVCRAVALISFGVIETEFIWLAFFESMIVFSTWSDSLIDLREPIVWVVAILSNVFLRRPCLLASWELF